VLPVTDFDAVVRGGRVVSGAAPDVTDVGVLDGVVAAVGDLSGADAAATVDAAGLVVLPGGIDPHVHFNEPGRTHWEGFATATHALAAGGMTTFFDMPLNSSPPTVDAAAFDRKAEAARAASVVDFGLWGGLVPGSVDRLEELRDRGVVGVKAFMAPSGLEEFPLADDVTLLEGMARCADLGLLVAVHAENAQITTVLAERARAAGRRGVRDYLASRPAVSEVEAIGRAVAFAEATGCALHVVHVSTGRGVALVAAARERGVDVTCETCSHHLVFAEDDAERLGTLGKCAPPLRARREVGALWQHVAAGAVDFVASDHSPCPPELKDTDDHFAAWGGIAGCQTTLPVLITEGHVERGLAWEAIARLTAGTAAERFGLPAKGRIEVGADADLALVEVTPGSALAAHDLHYRHRVSPWVGRRLRARVARTLLRGRTVSVDGRIVTESRGRLLVPAGRDDKASGIVGPPLGGKA
jgi:allantoinase